MEADNSTILQLEYDNSIVLTQKVHENIPGTLYDTNNNTNNLENNETLELESIDYDELSQDALQYLGGYIIKKLGCDNLGIRTSNVQNNVYTWVDQISEGGLYKPSALFYEELVKLENIFIKFNGEEFNYMNNFMKNIQLQAVSIPLPDKVKTLFFKCRMFFRIRNMNKTLKERKYKSNKKMNKIIN